MYVRWKKRAQTRRKRPTGDHMLTAVLVRSIRSDGSVRQEFIAHLGSIRQGAVSQYWHQFDFWATATAALDKQALEPAARAVIERSIAQIVPRPTPEGKAATAAQLANVESKL